MRNLSWKKTLIVCFAVASMCFCACNSIHYEGASDAPLAADAPVLVVYDKSQLKNAEPYQVLGTATFQTAPSSTRSEIQSKLQRFARTKGANGVLILSIDRVVTNRARKDQVNNQNTPSWQLVDSSSGTIPYVEDTIRYSTDKDPDENIYKQAVTADLLKLPESAMPAKQTYDPTPSLLD